MVADVKFVDGDNVAEIRDPAFCQLLPSERQPTHAWLDLADEQRGSAKATDGLDVPDCCPDLRPSSLSLYGRNVPIRGINKLEISALRP